MYCNKCQKPLGQCDCPDIVERLEALRKSPHIDAASCIDKPLAEIASRRARNERTRDGTKESAP